MSNIRNVLLVLLALVFLLPCLALAWQGRMAGMADPFGLVEDESDFLIHPSKVAEGEGVRYYGHYRFNYRDVKDWDYTFTSFDPTTGALLTDRPYRSSGDEQEHDGLVGATFPLGSGRTGLFLQYTGRRGDYDGKEDELFFGTPYLHNYDMESDLDEFSMRLLYGVPLGNLRAGGEIQLAYRNGENKTLFNEDVFGGGGAARDFITNDFFGQLIEWTNLFPFMFPYDSKFYEAVLKGSLDGPLGPAKFSFTATGGFILGGDNELNNSETSPVQSAELEGDVEGWRLGGDFWLRYPLKSGLSLPFLMRGEYRKITRDGDGTGTGGYAGTAFDYESEQKTFQAEAGGGIDKEFSKGRIAGGLYYSYLKGKNDFVLERVAPGLERNYDHSDYPDQTEHRVTMRLVGEKEFGSVVMRMGLNPFFGWVDEDYKFAYTNPVTPANNYTLETSLDGHHWGINASLGSTFRIQRLSVEPFLGGGYRKIDLEGDGHETDTPANLEMDKKREEWLVGGGFSILF